MKKPKFDAEGYQSNIEEINGETLPELKSLRFADSRRGRVPDVKSVRKAIAKTSNEPSGEALRGLRRHMNVTQARLAHALGVKLATYRQWETQRRKLTGPSRALVRLVLRRPELVQELAEAE